MKRAAAMTLALALPSYAAASGISASVSGAEQLDFALAFGSESLVLDYSNGLSADTELKWIGLTWYERMTPWLELGLHGGHVFLTQTNNTATAGIEPDGYYAGVGLRAVIAETSFAQYFAHARYTYQRVEHASVDQTITLSWNDPRVRLGAAFKPTQTFRVYAGAEWVDTNGQERLSGVSARTTNFSQRDNVGGFLGLDLQLEGEGHDGYVGLELRAGASRGANLYFKTSFSR